jgi:Domain of unknown function (DUF4396)
MRHEDDAPGDRMRHEHVDHSSMGSLTSVAASATLHCLTGCAIGEILGPMIGTATGLGTAGTITLSIGLAFLFGYTLSTFPLLRAGLALGAALRVVLAADTLSILTWRSSTTSWWPSSPTP